MYLILDTTGDIGLVALAKNGVIIKSAKLGEKRHSEGVMPAIKNLIESFDEVDFIAICVGPGSFTGSRVGVMIANTLSFAKKKPLLPYQTDIQDPAKYAFENRQNAKITPVSPIYLRNMEFLDKIIPVKHTGSEIHAKR